MAVGAECVVAAGAESIVAVGAECVVAVGAAFRLFIVGWKNSLKLFQKDSKKTVDFLCMI